LHDPEIVTELMWQLQKKAADADWNEKQTKQALVWAEMVADMLEDPRHSGSRIVSEVDPQTLPEVIGILLQLAGMRVSKHLEGKDEDGKVAKYAERLLATDLKVRRWASAQEQNQSLSALVPILHGMNVASTLLPSDKKMSQELKSRVPEVEKTVTTLRDAERARDGKKNKPRGLEIYDLVFGSESI